MVKTGVNVGTGLGTSKTFSQHGTDFKNTFMAPDAPANATPMGPMAEPRITGGVTGTTGSKPGFFSATGKALGGLQPGTMISGGLTGYGMGTLFGEGKSREKKALYGAAGGLLTGMLGGGFGGAISGGIGGLFGGLLS